MRRSLECFLLVEIFGDAGRHTRSAVGLAELPFGIAVEIELIAATLYMSTQPRQEASVTNRPFWPK